MSITSGGKSGSARPLALSGAALWLGLLALPAFGQAPPPAGAQVAPEAAEPADADSDSADRAIVVTGTRTRSGFNAPTPTMVVGEAEFQQRAVTNVYSLLSELPAFNSRLSGASNGIRTQTVGQTFADLRGLGSPRTLVLVDGRRFVPSVPASSVGNPYQVDLNLIPSLMIDRVDIVTGGASAQWGSDAVAGVVNLVLKKRFEGVQGELQSGISQRGDAAEFRTGIVAGFSFGESRGHVVVSGDYTRNDGIKGYRSRDWADDYCQFFTDAGATVANGRARQTLRCNTQPGNYTAGGLIVNTTNIATDQRNQLIGLQFDSATAVSQFVRGEFNPATTITTFAANQAGGNNEDRTRNSLMPAVERAVFFGRAEYEFSEALNFFAAGSYGVSTGSSTRLPSRDRTGIYDPATASGSLVRIYADNPYIPAALRPLIPAPATASTATPPAASFTLARVNYDNFEPITNLKDKAYTVATGFNGDLGGGWSWDSSYTYGHNDYFVESLGSRNRALYALAADAIRNPANPSQIICRSTLTNPNNGCVPVNLFGEGSPSLAAQNYYTGVSWARVIYQQHAAQINIQGEPFSTWAGPVAIAVGAEIRHEKIETTVDSISVTNVYDSGLGSDFRGDFTVKEGYLEATVPLLSNMPGAKSFVANGAVRHADYSGFGGATTWKVGATWEPFDGLLLRVGQSLDIRAPSLYELNVPSSISVSTVRLRGIDYPGVRVSNEGNRNLVPEEARTLTVGGSYQPRFIPGLRLSVDYYEINLAGVIAAVGRIQIADNCTAGIQSACALLTFDSAGALIGVRDQFVNLSSYRTSGFDIAASYDRPLFGGNLALRANATFVDKFLVSIPTVPGQPPVVVDRSNTINSNNEGNNPSWRMTSSATYSDDHFSLTGQLRFVGKGKYDPTLREVATATLPPDITPEQNNVPAYFLFNLSGIFNVLPDQKVQLFWVVNNVFDKNPPIVPALTTLLQTNGAFYDVVGRFYKVGVRFKF